MNINTNYNVVNTVESNPVHSDRIAFKKSLNIKNITESVEPLKKNEKICLDVLRSLQNLSSELFFNSEIYKFLKRNTKGFYLEYGREINTFLRTGELKKTPVLSDDMPAVIREYAEKQIKEIKLFNRAIVDSVEILDSKMTSRTQKPMIVYRDAPQSWIKGAQDGIVTENAFCSTSTVAGASMEGLIGSNAHKNVRYEIRLPEGIPFLDLTYTSEKEMLLPRNCKFKVIGENILELIP